MNSTTKTSKLSTTARAGHWLLAALCTFLLGGAGHPLMARQQTPTPETNTTTLAEATNQAPAQPEAPASNIRETFSQPAIFSDYTLDAGKTNHDDAVAVWGNSRIEGVVQGSSVTVFGNARITGKVEGDLVVVMGSLELGPHSEVIGNVVVVGGKLDRSPQAKIDGNPVVLDPDRIPFLGGALPWITHGLLLGRPLPFGVRWAWEVASIFLLINLLLLAIFPRPIQACVDTVERQPMGSFFVGILAKLVFGLLLTLLIISVVGVVVVPFLFAALVVAFLIGKITIYRYVGQQVGRQVRLDILQSPAIALVIGTAIFYLLYAVPFLGFIAWGFTTIFGFGAVVMAAIQKLRTERVKAPPASPVGQSPPPDAGGPVPVTPVTPQTPASPAATPACETVLWPRAGFWIRLCALGLDAMLFMIPLMVLSNTTHNAGGPGLFLLLLWLAYHVLLWVWKGTTVGGIIMGIKVVRVDGRSLDFPVALIRALASVLSAFVLGLGFFWVGLTKEKQAWHDKVAGTVVVRVPYGISLV